MEMAVQSREPQSFCPDGDGWREQRGWASDQKHSYLEGRLPGEHYLRTPQKGGTPKDGGEHPWLKEGVGREVPKSSQRQEAGPVIFSSGPFREGTVRCVGPTAAQQAAQEKWTCLSLGR